MSSVNLNADEATVLLGLVAGTLFLLYSFYRPQPLLHPILLGRQSDVGRVRNAGESAVYRNYGTGLMGRFPVRPQKDVHLLHDLVRTDFDAPRTLWDSKITNQSLLDRAAALGTGLIRLADLQPQDSNVLLLLNDCIEFVISDLALAAHSIPSFTLASSDLLATVLQSHPPSAIVTHAEVLTRLLELIYDSGELNRNHTIIVVGEPSAQVMATVASRIKVLKWTDVEREGVRVQKILSPVPKPTDVFTVSFFSSGTGHVQGVQLTHENITAGVAAVRALVPLAQAMSPVDTIVSAYPLSTAFGRTVAYAAIFEGCSFATLDSCKLLRTNDAKPRCDVSDVLSVQLYPIPSPTIMFLKPDHSQSITEAILREAKKNFVLFSFAWRQKVAAINEGFLTKDSLWDRLVFDSARATVVGDIAGSLRSVVVGGGQLRQQFLTPSRIAFSTPFVNILTHPVVAGPIMASHPLDLQDFYIPHAVNESSSVPVGPPSINIEAKLVGVSDDVIENGGDPEGVLLVRGPSVGKLPNVEDYVDVSTNGTNGDSWIGTGVRAKVETTGAFRIVE